MAVPEIDAAGRYILKNHMVGRTPQFTPINEYIVYDESLKPVQFIRCTVVEIKAATDGLDSLKSVSAAWLLSQGAFNGKR